jgi:hypothetical protein
MHASSSPKISFFFLDIRGKRNSSRQQRIDEELERRQAEENSAIVFEGFIFEGSIFERQTIS